MNSSSDSETETDDDLRFATVDDDDEDEDMRDLRDVQSVSLNSGTETTFFEEIPEEVRKLYDLRFSVYVDAQDANWICIVMNNKNKKTTMQGTIQTTTSVPGIKQRAELQALVEALQFIYSTCDTATKSFVCVEVFTESVYLVNVVREWLVKWQHQLQSRPHAELLQKLWSFLQLHSKNIEISWLPTQSSPHLLECRNLLIG